MSELPDVAIPLPARPWLVPELLRDQDCLIVTGRPGTGKSWLLYQLALCCAAGRHLWGGQPVRPVTTFYIDLGRRLPAVRRRMALLARAAGLPPELVADSGTEGEILQVMSRPQGLDLLCPGQSEWLLGTVLDAGAELVILSPLHLGALSPEGTAQVLAVLDSLRAKCRCTLVIETSAIKSIRGPASLKPGRDPTLLHWPELGLGLRPAPGQPEPPELFELACWRAVHHANRGWPAWLRRRGNLWVPAVPGPY